MCQVSLNGTKLPRFTLFYLINAWEVGLPWGGATLKQMRCTLTHQIFYLLFFLFIALNFTACTSFSKKEKSTATLPDPAISASRIPSLSKSSLQSPIFSRSPDVTSFAKPTANSNLVDITPTWMPSQNEPTFPDLPQKATLSAGRATPVPPGVFLLKFYPPLVMAYDMMLWTDESQYENQAKMINYLQAQNIETCTVGPIGPSGFYPYPDETVQLNEVRYQVKTLERPNIGVITTYYFEDNSLSGYDYDIGIPVLEIQASPGEWKQCITQAEEVLATLHANV
jgi:hypothetical protein